MHVRDINLMDEDVYNVRKNTEVLINANKEIFLQIKVAKTKYIFLSRDENIGRNFDMNIVLRKC